MTGGFPIGVDCKVCPTASATMDKRGREMWDRVMGLLDREEDGSRVEAARLQCRGFGHRVSRIYDNLYPNPRQRRTFPCTTSCSRTLKEGSNDRPL